MSGPVLIAGATSRLGQALADVYGREGRRLLLAGRDAVELGVIAADLTIRHGCECRVVDWDAADSASCARTGAELAAGELPEITIFVVGAIDGTEDAWRDADAADRLLAINYGGIVRLLAPMLDGLLAKPGCTVAFVSSVAGDRGRRTNFIYGAAKAALNAYAQGLRAEMAAAGSSVLTVKLGMMDTRMSFGRAPALLTCSPEYAAAAIGRLIAGRRLVAYVPWFWWGIMSVLKAIPERPFIRLPIP
ncbi:SDR family NAD(P)-dependent oxidoreductase [Magnetospirillum sp. 15-1]|uniref:SDR family NAD(P)-dependent oxidoreductase n=1 Tax=Magnetospirillum sp. 15-1 TaxID=1979370 RepID=UPI000BBB79CF|nr:SDR family NAD(P)-dependent oxidoreductase [Magnetospirillum sp. 15-1]